MNAKTMIELLQTAFFPGAVTTLHNPTTVRITIGEHTLDYVEDGYWLFNGLQHESLLSRRAASPSDIHEEIRRVLLLKLEIEALRNQPLDDEQALNVLARRVAEEKLELIILGAQEMKHWREARAAQDEVSALRKTADILSSTVGILTSALAALNLNPGGVVDILDQVKAYSEGRREERVMLDKAQERVRELGEALIATQRALAEATEGERVHVAALRQRAELAEEEVVRLKGEAEEANVYVRELEAALVQERAKLAEVAEAEEAITDVAEARAKLWTDMASFLDCDPNDEQGPFLVVRTYLNRIAHLESLPGAQDLDALLRFHGVPTTFNGRELSSAERACYLIQRGQQSAWNARSEVNALRTTLDGVNAALDRAGVPYYAEQGVDYALALDPGQRILWALPQRHKSEPKKV